MIYTKEPWEIRKTNFSTYIMAKDGSGNPVAIASVFPRGIAGCETEDNARLMMGSIKMYKPLCALRDWFTESKTISMSGDDMKTFRAICQEALTAITEIEGRKE